ncbi:hypothetical protein GCM10009841_01550 [Microlunatus panaciterrae]|uniref:Acyl-coenzyme A synthetase/AMP-(Fatty) acid ligase n=1 Tax=Microlunatus panaciterrae TaxID=400768 RepID=A0ABS2RL72_9ACTN|nr:AMP-binding protein [Microlunatus panaciterrae]MBM7799237.1 acyl-coenzyme A synthetase/AMP-(fatty) acid ligase [Microlunatus panaciterrae]
MSDGSGERRLSAPEESWVEQADAVDWFTRPRRNLDSRSPHDRRYEGGSLNVCYNALDRHIIRGRADEPALIFHSAIPGERSSFSFAELLDRVARLGGALSGLGVRRGDRVIIQLPRIAEAVMAMLACARIGAVHSVVDAGAAPSELTDRVDDARPTVVVAASCGLAGEQVVEYKPMLDAALANANHGPDHCIIVQRHQARAELSGPRDLDFRQLMRPGAFEPAACVAVAAEDPLDILYTSGISGRPQGIVRDTGGQAVALCHSMRVSHDIHPGEVVYTTTEAARAEPAYDYAPLLVGATVLLHEGEPVGPQDDDGFAKLVEEHRAKVLTATCGPSIPDVSPSSRR